MRRSLVCLFVLSASASSLAAQQDNWSRFRGARGDGVVPNDAHPAAWGEEKNLAWTVDLPGAGWSSPVVVGERIFVTTAVGAGRLKAFMAGARATRNIQPKPKSAVDYRVVCLRLGDGETLWSKSVGKNVPAFGIHPSNSYATASPATDGKRLFVTFGALGAIVALDLEGNELWHASVGVYPMGNDFGWGSSLVTDGSLVFAQSDNEKQSFLIALDAKTGKEVWRVDRKKGSSWSTPLLWRSKSGTRLVALGPGNAAGYDPTTGELVWQITDFRGSFTASPAIAGDSLVLGNSGPGLPGMLLAVRSGLSGKVSYVTAETEAATWVARRAGPGLASPIVVGDLVYSLGSMGIVRCRDAKTGERHYRKRLPAARSIVASPWSDGKRLFVLDEDGKTFVVRVGKTFELVRTNELPGLHWSTPSVAGKSLLIRSAKRLVCVRTAE